MMISGCARAGGRPRIKKIAMLENVHVHENQTVRVVHENQNST